MAAGPLRANLFIATSELPIKVMNIDDATGTLNMLDRLRQRLGWINS